MLTPILATFRTAFPEIRLDIAVSNQSLNLSKRDADVAIRASNHPGDTLVGRRIATIAWAVYGRPDLMGSMRLEPRDLRRHQWIGFSEALGTIKPAKWLRERVGEDQLVYRVNTVLGLAEAAAAGIGLAVLPCFIGATIPGLVRLMPPDPEMEAGLWLLTHPDIRTTARVRSFMDHTGRELARLRPRIEGRESAAPLTPGLATGTLLPLSQEHAAHRPGLHETDAPGTSPDDD